MLAQCLATELMLFCDSVAIYSNNIILDQKQKDTKRRSPHTVAGRVKYHSRAWQMSNLCCLQYTAKLYCLNEPEQSRLEKYILFLYYLLITIGTVLVCTDLLMCTYHVLNTTL